MIPIPIYIPRGSAHIEEYIFPWWVEIIAYIGLGLAMIGILWIISAIILSIITERIDPFEKPHTYSLAVCLSGLAIMLIAIVLMMLTGQPITE